MTFWIPEWLVWLFAAYGAVSFVAAISRGILRVLGESRAAPAPAAPPPRAATKDEPQPPPVGRPTKS